MIKKGNFSGNAVACHKLGKEAFYKTQAGLYNGDLNELWALIEKEAQAGQTKAGPPQNKVDGPRKN